MHKSNNCCFGAGKCCAISTFERFVSKSCTFSISRNSMVQKKTNLRHVDFGRSCRTKAFSNMRIALRNLSTDDSKYFRSEEKEISNDFWLKPSFLFLFLVVFTRFFNFWDCASKIKTFDHTSYAQNMF